MSSVDRARILSKVSVDQLFDVFTTLDFKDRNIYGNYLAQTYYYVHQVTRVLSFAAGKCDIKTQLNLHERLLNSLKEESNHDLLAKNDLEYLGFNLEMFPEQMETRNFFESIFYTIETYGPNALLGYFFPQEGLASNKLTPLYQQLKDLYGEEATTFLKEHCILDVKHYHNALKLLDLCTEEELKAIEIGIRRSTELYKSILLAIPQMTKNFKSIIEPMSYVQTI